ncbi:hypothetical protein BHF71_02860 [Vulcanibacillus modesticaldus]|uniref:Uncharacterized protein n=1 Tax=Vulcanibacillus modesticaldus TaxID=337097 RepID=A0A1D2YT53_9BACI|nr:hypothetical protein [Vulcanibacillus modesticaldus]OEF98884.1 hypothetical protein BHF71_02860 [Vulcanibacillus modesticaldus]
MEDLATYEELIARIIEEAKKLQHLFWSKEELQQLQRDIDSLEERLLHLSWATLSNLEWYKDEGWKKLFDRENDLRC